MSLVRAASPRDVAAWLLGRRVRVRVAGPSMEPALPDGSTVLVKPGGAPQPQDIVLVEHPMQADLRILKRVDHITDDGRIFLRGDGTVSTDSRDFGAVPPERVLGRVVCTLP